MLRMILIAAAVAVILILLFAPGKKTPPPKTGRRSEPQYPGSNDVTQKYVGPVQNAYMYGKHRFRK